MIVRVFRVTVPADLHAEFEPKFETVSLSAVAQAPGCLRVVIGRPISDSAGEYVMVSEWEDIASLKAFAGEGWEEPHIPEGMEKYTQTCSVSHFERM